ncbi:MAG: hypothetical protein ACLU9S_21620 [Oscillospiraceae bacterium]
MRRRELLSAVEWNCSRLKAAILNQISRGEHSGSRVCGVYDIPFDGNWDDSVPYGNLFAAGMGHRRQAPRRPHRLSSRHPAVNPS